MDPFQMALDAQFTSPGSEASLFVPAGRPALGVRIIRSRPDRLTRFGDTFVMAASHAIEVRKSEVASPVVGDVFVTASDRLEVTIEPMIDVEGLAWTCGAEPIA